jgi:Na+/H+-dicarboxylate symporter
VNSILKALLWFLAMAFLAIACGGMVAGFIGPQIEGLKTVNCDQARRQVFVAVGGRE